MSKELTTLFSKTTPPAPKSKTQAVIGAMMLGPLVWIYTYKEDKIKLWINLALSIVLSIVLVGGLIAAFANLQDWLAAISSPESSSSNASAPISKASGLALAISTLGLLALWVWPFIDVLKRPRQWYQQYGEDLSQTAKEALDQQATSPQANKSADSSLSDL